MCLYSVKRSSLTTNVIGRQPMTRRRSYGPGVPAPFGLLVSPHRRSVGGGGGGSAHVRVPPVREGLLGLLHHLRRRPPQDVVRTSGFVIGS